MNLFNYVFGLLRWFKGHRGAVTVVAVCLLVEMGFSAWVPMAFSHLIDHAIVPRDHTVLVHVLAALGVAVLLTTAAGMTGDFVYARLNSGVVARLRQRLFDHMQSLPPSFFQKYSAGEISARYTTDLAGVEQTLGTWIAWGWKPSLDIIGYNLVMFTVDWRVAVFAQLLWPMTLLGPRLFGPKASASAEERKNREAAVLTAVDEAYGSRLVVRAFGLERTMSARFAARLSSLATAVVRGAIFTSALERSASVGIYLLQIALLAIGGAMAFRGAITVGGLVAFYTVFTSLSNCLYYLAQYSGSLISSAAGLARIEEILAEKDTVPEAPGASELPPIRDAITVRDCVFTPVPGRRILDGIALTIRHGESVAFVGPSGSGKSTLLNAIMRAFDPDGGAIAIDGHDLRSVTKASLIRQSAVVFQESFLYNTTIRENLRLGRLDATEAEIEAACRDAEIHDMILAMPQGYDSPVGERGSLLSGGQRQRLAIARALLRNPRILFLDEATSALDPGTEIAINATVDRIARGRTVLRVTHRLASVVNLDRIFVMNQGRLAEQGTHAELLACGGLYASLWRKQEGIHTNDDGTRAVITIERLRQVALLARLDEAMLRELSTSQFVTENIPAGRDVVVEGDPGDKFYIIARGRVEVCRRDAAGVNQRVHLLEDGDNFGELALLRDVPRGATIRTLVPCIFLTLQRHYFTRLLDHSPEVRAAILAQEAERTMAPGGAGSTASPFGADPVPG
jgi:ATP-binding cassette subfamily B protein